MLCSPRQLRFVSCVCSAGLVWVCGQRTTALDLVDSELRCIRYTIHLLDFARTLSLNSRCCCCNCQSPFVFGVLSLASSSPWQTFWTNSSSHTRTPRHFCLFQRTLPLLRMVFTPTTPARLPPPPPPPLTTSPNTKPTLTTLSLPTQKARRKAAE